MELIREAVVRRRTPKWPLAIPVVCLASLFLGPMLLDESIPRCKPKTDTARQMAVTIATAVERRHRREGVCVFDKHAIGRRHNDEFADPWGSGYLVVCSPGLAIAVSFGPDGKRGTRDDIFGTSRDGRAP